jgi:hypothetical protein
MKKSLILTVLLAGLLFYGCGSKGGTAASSNGSESSSTTGGAAFALNMVDSNNAQNVASKITVTGTPPDPSNVRVVIRSFATVTTTQLICPNDNYNDSGDCNVAYVPTEVGSFQEVYRDIQDVLYSGSTVTIGIPQGNGYTLDVITYNNETTNKSILKYGRITNVDIPNTTNSATVIMTAVADILQMTVAPDVIPNQTFTVTVNNVMPFALSYKMIMSFGTTTVQKITAAKTTTFTAPVTYDSGQTVALQGQFVLDRSCLKTGESSASWTRLFPNPAYSEDVYSNLTPLIVVSLPNI